MTVRVSPAMQPTVFFTQYALLAAGCNLPHPISELEDRLKILWLAYPEAKRYT